MQQPLSPSTVIPVPPYDRNAIANTTPTSPALSDTPMVAAPPVLAGDAPELVPLAVDFAPLAPELAVAPDGVGRPVYSDALVYVTQFELGAGVAV